jgi:hypothetical protein
MRMGWRRRRKTKRGESKRTPLCEAYWVSDKIDVTDGMCNHMIKHLFLSNPSSCSSSALASRLLASSFSRDSTGNQSAIRFINAQSTFASRVRGLVRALKICQVMSWLVENHLQRSAVCTQGDRHIGQFDFPCFCIFTRHLVLESIHFEIACRVHLPNAKKVST